MEYIKNTDNKDVERKYHTLNWGKTNDKNLFVAHLIH